RRADRARTRGQPYRSLWAALPGRLRLQLVEEAAQLAACVALLAGEAAVACGQLERVDVADAVDAGGVDRDRGRALVGDHRVAVVGVAEQPDLARVAQETLQPSFRPLALGAVVEHDATVAEHRVRDRVGVFPTPTVALGVRAEHHVIRAGRVL